MNPFEIAGGILLLIASIVIILVVMLQETKQAGMGAITGGTSDSFVSKNGARTKEAFLAKLTKILAIGFFIVSIGLDLIVRFVK